MEFEIWNLCGYAQQVHPQVQPGPGQLSPQAQLVHEQLLLPQLHLALLNIAAIFLNMVFIKNCFKDLLIQRYVVSAG